MANLRILYKNDVGDYVWNFQSAKQIINSFACQNKISKSKIYTILAGKTFLTEGATKNWFTNKNGPGDIEQVRKVAEYLNVDYIRLLRLTDDNKNTIMEETFDEEIVEYMMNMNSEIDLRTIMFVEMLNDLAEKSKNGFIGFSKYRNEDDRNSIIFDDKEGPNYGMVILDMCVDGICHHDIISTYNDYLYDVNYDVRVIDDDEGGYFIDVTCDHGVSFCVENGKWYRS